MYVNKSPVTQYFASIMCMPTKCDYHKINVHMAATTGRATKGNTHRRPKTSF